ncbi:MAG TPA: cytidylate kinase-like family protein [Draconibacterium sp.]|nr:cytidylate kinase-like family protein [Draconibacterium sp.]
MSNLLLTYLNKRMTEYDIKQKSAKPVAGPVITISREVGCNGVKLANLIVARLNSKKSDGEWKMISKEVFEESAKELKMAPEQVRKTLHQSERFVFEDMIKAFSDKNYKSDLTIGNTMKRVILQIATEGNCIIVGRAGHIIASSIKNALHIRLVAPLDYRINTIMHNNHLTREESISFINRVEKERINFRKAILKENHQNELFDITFNRGAFSDEEIVDIIEFTAIKKELFR